MQRAHSPYIWGYVVHELCYIRYTWYRQQPASHKWHITCINTAATILVLQGSNIFIAADGAWLLGDFGSAIAPGEPVTSYTTYFHKELLFGVPAQASHDWYMLGVALAVELCKEAWKEMLMDAGTQRPVDSKLLAVVAGVHTPQLCQLLTSILQWGGVDGAAGACAND